MMAIIWALLPSDLSGIGIVPPPPACCPCPGGGDMATAAAGDAMTMGPRSTCPFSSARATRDRGEREKRS